MSDACLLNRNSLDWLDSLDAGTVDLVLADPPYSSGGLHAGDRRKPTSTKYTQHGSKKFKDVDFQLDGLDQRSWIKWSTRWLESARVASRQGAYCLTFCDWRQLPALTDAFQMAGWFWRGIIAWNKGRAARLPYPHYFRQQCEFVVWGTNGGIDQEVPTLLSGGLGTLDGCLTHPVLAKSKLHPVGKPLPLIRELVNCCKPGGLVIDPFAGSGTTAVAAIDAGCRFAGCEIDPRHFAIARQRIAHFKRYKTDMTWEGLQVQTQ